MPSKRRMINPDIWFSLKVASFPRDGRLFFIGLFSNADDDGILRGENHYLKARIFPYDKDITVEQINEFKVQLETLSLLSLYSVNGNEYIWLKTFRDQQQIRKDLYQPTDLPKPDDFIPTRDDVPQLNTPPLQERNESVTSPLQECNESVTPPCPSQVKSSQGQSSQVKYSIVKSKDYGMFRNNKDGLTDLMLTTLESCASAGGAKPQFMEIFKKCWKDITGEEIPSKIFQGIWDALEKYDLKVIAIVFSKGMIYKGGKNKSWNYFKKIFDEEGK